MISIFPLRTFHLYVETFQQHLHMECISRSLFDIPELVCPYVLFLFGHCVVCSSSIYGFWSHFGIFKLFSFHSTMHNFSIVRDIKLYLRLYFYIPLFVYSSDNNAVYFTFLWILSGFCRNNRFFILYLLQGSHLYRMDDFA